MTVPFDMPPSLRAARRWSRLWRRGEAICGGPWKNVCRVLAAACDRAGVERTRELISTALGEGYAQSISAGTGAYGGHPVVIVTVRAPLPLIGMAGLPDALEVSGRAALEPLR